MADTSHPQKHDMLLSLLCDITVNTPGGYRCVSEPFTSALFLVTPTQNKCVHMPPTPVSARWHLVSAVLISRERLSACSFSAASAPSCRSLSTSAFVFIHVFTFDSSGFDSDARHYYTRAISGAADVCNERSSSIELLGTVRTEAIFPRFTICNGTPIHRTLKRLE